MSRISCPRQGAFKDQDEAVSKARLRKHQPVMRQSVCQTHRLVDMGTPIAAGVAEKPEHILRKPASRRASRGLVDATRGFPHHPQTGQLSYFLVSVGVVRGAWRFDDMCGLIPSPPLTAFPRRLY